MVFDLRRQEDAGFLPPFKRVEVKDVEATACHGQVRSFGDAAAGVAGHFRQQSHT
jgi:hypothetical protein